MLQFVQQQQQNVGRSEFVGGGGRGGHSHPAVFICRRPATAHGDRGVGRSGDGGEEVSGTSSVMREEQVEGGRGVRERGRSPDKVGAQCVGVGMYGCVVTTTQPLLPRPGGGKARCEQNNGNEIVKLKARKFSLLQDLQRDVIPFPSSHRRHMHLSVTIPAALPRIPSQDST